jgi:hypothetical protein
MSKQSKQGNLESVSAGSARSHAEAVATTDCNEVEVREQAYSCWQERGCPAGSPDEDWLRAERGLNGRAALSAEKNMAEVSTNGRMKT